MNGVHAARMFVQLFAPSLEVPVHCIDPASRYRVTYLVQCVCEARHHDLPRYGRSVQIEDQMTKPNVWMVQPLDDRIQRGAFLRDKENATPLGHALRKDVRDRLTLASSRWSLHDAVLALSDKHDGAVLSGVRVEHEIIVSGGALVQLSGLDVDHCLAQLLP